MERLGSPAKPKFCTILPKDRIPHASNIKVNLNFRPFRKWKLGHGSLGNEFVIVESGLEIMTDIKGTQAAKESLCC